MLFLESSSVLISLSLSSNISYMLSCVWISNHEISRQVLQSDSKCDVDAYRLRSNGEREEKCGFSPFHQQSIRGKRSPWSTRNSSEAKELPLFQLSFPIMPRGFGIPCLAYSPNSLTGSTTTISRYFAYPLRCRLSSWQSLPMLIIINYQVYKIVCRPMPLTDYALSAGDEICISSILYLVFF